MSSSEQRRTVNRANALKSTGPTTDTGRATSSRNAERHGLLSSRLFVEDEEPAEFAALQLELQSALAPVGAAELAIVERIAISLWRQRRLVSAETAEIGLSRMPRKIAGGVSSALALSYGSELKEDDLQPFDLDQLRWCKVVVSEIEKLEQIDLKSLPSKAPTLFGQLQSDAAEDDDSIEVHLEGRTDGITGYVGELFKWCREQLEDAERRPHVLALAEQVRARRLILPDDALDIFSRYQTTLDNQLYKALRALRDAQEWRFKTLDTTTSVASNQVQAA